MDCLPTVQVESQQEEKTVEEFLARHEYDDSLERSKTVENPSAETQKKQARGFTMGARGSSSFISLSEVKAKPVISSRQKLSYSAWFRNFFCNSDADIPIDGNGSRISYDR